MILGDFNLAPRIGRPFRTTLSIFTSACKRSAFAKLTHDHDLIDDTASDEPGSHSAGWAAASPSSCRCDLPLIPVWLSPSIMTVSSKTTSGATAFSEHSGPVLDLG